MNRAVNEKEHSKVVKKNATVISTHSHSYKPSRSFKSLKRGRKYRTKSALLGAKIKIQKYKIPKKKFKAVMKILESEKNPWVAPTWEDGCHLSPDLLHHATCGTKRNSFARLLSECRAAVLKRDWVNLSALLTIVKPVETYDYAYYMPYFYKYAIICLMHTSEGASMDNFLRGVIGCENDREKEFFLKSLSTFYVSPKTEEK